MTTVTELATTLTTISDQLVKAKSEILDKITKLEDLINAGTVPPEVETALENLRTAAQTLDDVVPDTAPAVAMSKR